MDKQRTLALAIDKLFPDRSDAETVRSLLPQFSCPPDWRTRISLAVLKLCESDIDQIRALLANKHLDPRDVISMAEYPLQSGIWKVDGKGDPEYEAEYRAAIEQDLEDHNAWLEKMSSNT